MIVLKGSNFEITLRWRLFGDEILFEINTKEKSCFVSFLAQFDGFWLIFHIFRAYFVKKTRILNVFKLALKRGN